MVNDGLILKSPLKWAGGKSKLMEKIEKVYNEDFFWYGENYTYIELFGGGGNFSAAILERSSVVLVPLAAWTQSS